VCRRYCCDWRLAVLLAERRMPAAARVQCTLLRLAVAALLVSGAATQRVNVQISDHVQHEARSNEIDW
jgi:hypothetical protein